MKLVSLIYKKINRKVIILLILLFYCINLGDEKNACVSNINYFLPLLGKSREELSESERELLVEKQMTFILLEYISCHLANEEREKKKREAGILGKIGIYK